MRADIAVASALCVASRKTVACKGRVPGICLPQRRRKEALNCIERLSAVLRSGQDEGILDGSEQHRCVVVCGRIVVAEPDQRPRWPRSKLLRGR